MTSRWSASSTTCRTVVSRSYIVPVVARLAEPAPARPGVDRGRAGAVAAAAELVRPDTYRAERWGAPPGERVLHFFELDDETVWGATAFMLVDLLAPLDASAGDRYGAAALQQRPGRLDVAPLRGAGADRESQHRAAVEDGAGEQHLAAWRWPVRSAPRWRRRRRRAGGTPG